MNPLVSISCITYNQVEFIKETLESFLKQKTSFGFEVLIHDDCSTDGTTEIIKDYAKKYPDIFFPIYEEVNQFSLGVPAGSAVWNLPRARGKYFALCEGDDYWTDPNKLQKQVDFLESHPDYGMCYTKVLNFNQSLKTTTLEWGGPAETFYDLLKINTVPTLSTMFRTSIYNAFVDEVRPYEHNWKMGDYPIWLYIALKSKIKFMDFVTGCYRVLNESACHTQSLSKSHAFRKNYFQIKDFYLKKYNTILNDTEITELGQIKYFALLPAAIILGDKEIINEAHIFFKNRPKTLRTRLLLDVPIITKPLLKMRYRRRGFHF